MSLFKKTLDNVGGVVNKAQVGTAALSLEAQKKAKEGNVTQAIQQLKTQREGVYCRMGQKCCELRQEGEFDDERFSEYFGLLDDIAVSIKDQEAVLDDIRRKFDEEISLLKGTAVSKPASCSQCGEAYTVGVDLFCAGCGADLRKAQPQCPNCGQAYNPERAAFCKKCGHNLKKIEGVEG